MKQCKEAKPIRCCTRSAMLCDLERALSNVNSQKLRGQAGTVAQTSWRRRLGAEIGRDLPSITQSVAEG